jgi:hypothetical protein
VLFEAVEKIKRYRASDRYPPDWPEMEAADWFCDSVLPLAAADAGGKQAPGRQVTGHGS